MNTGTNSGGFEGQGQGMVSRRARVEQRRELIPYAALAVRPVRLDVPARLECQSQRRQWECAGRDADDGVAEAATAAAAATAATAERFDYQHDG